MISTFFSIMKYILNEPSNKHQRVRRIIYFILWQIYKRTIKKPLILKLDNGTRFIAYTHCEGASFPVYINIFDSEIVSFIRKQFNNKGIMVDVGANVGLYTLLLCNHFKGGHVFEPDNAAFTILSDNLFINRIHEAFKAYNVALSDYDGLAKFSNNPTSLVNKIIDENSAGITSVKTVEVHRLDSCISEEYWNELEYVKIDVEGKEINVLHGMEKIIQKNKPELIQFERLRHTNFEILESFFNKYKWKLFVLKNGQPCFQNDEIQSAHDIFAIPPTSKMVKS